MLIGKETSSHSFIAFGCKLQGLKEEVDVQNCWRRLGNIGDSMPHGTMHEHYSDLRLLASIVIPYSKAM